MIAAFRKRLSAPGLLKTLRSCFHRVPDHRSGKSEIPLVDALMSGLTVFGLKYPSLLKFDEERHEGTVRHNLSSLYGVERAPCDSSCGRFWTRWILGIYGLPARHSLPIYSEAKDWRLMPILEGTGVFSSSSLCCKECCVKNHRKGGVSYFHQLLGAVIVHPEQKVVIPLAPEPITRQDGASKNDCEGNAAKRLLTDLRREHPLL